MGRREGGRIEGGTGVGLVSKEIEKRTSTPFFPTTNEKRGGKRGKFRRSLSLRRRKNTVRMAVGKKEKRGGGDTKTQQRLSRLFLILGEKMEIVFCAWRCFWTGGKRGRGGGGGKPVCISRGSLSPEGELDAIRGGGRGGGGICSCGKFRFAPEFEF